MKSIKRTAALIIALILMSTAAQAEWKAAQGNSRRFLQMLDLLGDSVEKDGVLDTAALDAKMAEIREASEDDYDIAKAIADNWKEMVLDPEYRLFIHRDGDRAFELEQSGLDFSGKHAFIVLGYKLDDGEISEELMGRCDAAGAAAASYPDSILITTGGVTGSNNPKRHTEAGQMKEYLEEYWQIDPGRIFTEKKAKTTLENALNTFRILEENGIETFTIVTSNYHLFWAQVLFNAQAAIYEKETGYRVRMVGNYNYLAEPQTSPVAYARTGLTQMAALFRK